MVGNANSAYLITAANRPEDVGTMNGIVVKSVEFDAYQGGVLLAPNLPIPGVAILHMNYNSNLPLSGMAVSSVVKDAPANMSVYWYNGVAWVQLYGTDDGVDETLNIETKFVGKYQLRTVQRAGTFSFSMAGVSNRFVTPNGDGKNDNVVFTFDNPNNASVSSKILDMRGRVVAGSLPPGSNNPTGSLMWDGTSGGRSVPSGVYIYQIQAEGHSYSGTLVVLK